MGDGLFQRIRIKGFSDGEADQPAVTALNQHPDGIGVKISAGGKHLQNSLIGKSAGLTAGQSAAKRMFRGIRIRQPQRVKTAGSVVAGDGKPAAPEEIRFGAQKIILILSEPDSPERPAAVQADYFVVEPALFLQFKQVRFIALGRRGSGVPQKVQGGPGTARRTVKRGLQSGKRRAFLQP